MTSSQPISAQQLPAALREAAMANGGLVVVAMASLPNCPWCDLVIRDQLTPRMRSRDQPRMVAVILDITDRRPIQRPETASAMAGLDWLRQSPQQWARRHRIRMAPTVFPIDLSGQPIGEPLVGYSSVDFYGAYLEDRIQLAKARWAREAHKGAAT